VGKTRFRRLEVQGRICVNNVKRGMDSSLNGNRASYRLVSEFNVFILFCCCLEQGEQFVFVWGKKYLLLRCDSIV
jgi:hypothetical protein